MEPTPATVEQLLRNILHPASGKDIVTAGLVENIRVDGKKIHLRLVFPQPDPLAAQLKKEIETILSATFPDAGIKGNIMELIRDKKPAAKPPATTEYNGLTEVKNILAVASGKGGVGKSTVAVNLAVALAAMGCRVGLADADIYGPSVPKMIAAENEQPLMQQSGGKEQILPVERYGVKWMSVGFFVPSGQPLIWRGPMTTGALRQLVRQAAWGALDVLLIDLPPGTGDIHLNIIHELPLTGAIVVSTPQALALADVEKGVNMFLNKNVRVNVLGIVENMAWFTPAELPQNRYYLFGKGGAKALAQKMRLPLLAQIPLVQSICDSGDSGIPVALLDTPASAAFRQLASAVKADLRI
ncbi:MAG: Mrp/NBP35 family ATP-binding protein [Prevotellaceae bacterium]|jgi:ATP-binding protein involved in chromosome partitioning|nr:Mrp/NBP35 family ATP-binding protein [Prevotellaceae bacterium]